LEKLEVQDDSVKLPKIDVIPNGGDNVDHIINEAMRQMYSVKMTNKGASVMRSTINKIFAHFGFAGKKFPSYSKYRKFVKKDNPLDKSFMFAYWKDKHRLKASVVDGENDSDSDEQPKKKHKSKRGQKKKRYNYKYKKKKKSGLVHRLSLPYHIARFFSSKDNCKYVHFFPEECEKPYSVHTSPTFKKLYDDYDDCLVLGLTLFICMA